MRKLPVNVQAVISAALDTDKARHKPLSVSVYLDDTAPDELQAHVREIFASSAPDAHVSMVYLDERPFSASQSDDIAVIVAGENPQIGAYAAHVRSAGVPVMVVTTQPSEVDEAARAQGHPIPVGDLISPAKPILKVTAVDETKPLLTMRVVSVADEEVEEEKPLVLDKAAYVSLDERMGRWIIEACRHKRLALAYAFPFVRRPLSYELVNATSMQNAGIGLVFFLPGADMPVMTLNQAKMLLEIAAVYDEKLGLARAKELAAVVGGGFACRAVARQFASAVPVLGWAIKAAVGYTGTVAMGRAAIRYYEDGATLSSLTKVVASARDKAVQAAANAAARKARSAGAQILKNIRSSVSQTKNSSYVTSTIQTPSEKAQ